MWFSKTGSNRACLAATRSDYSRATLGFNSYTLSVNISDNGTPVKWAVRQFTLVVEPTNDRAPQAADKVIAVKTFNGKFDDVPLGNVNVEGPDDWESDRTYQLVGSPTPDPYFT